MLKSEDGSAPYRFSKAKSERCRPDGDVGPFCRHPKARQPLRVGERGCTVEDRVKLGRLFVRSGGGVALRRLNGRLGDYEGTSDGFTTGIDYLDC